MQFNLPENKQIHALNFFGMEWIQYFGTHKMQDAPGFFDLPVKFK